MKDRQRRTVISVQMSGWTRVTVLAIVMFFIYINGNLLGLLFTWQGGRSE